MTRTVSLGVRISEQADFVKNEVFNLREKKTTPFLVATSDTKEKYKDISTALRKDSIAMCDELRAFRDGTHEELGNTSGAAMRKEDLSLAEMIQAKYGINSVNEYLTLMGINTERVTVAKFSEIAKSINNPALVANVILDAIRLGLTRATMYKAITARQINIEAATITVPYIGGISDPVQERAEGETIKRTRLRVGSKNVVTTDLAQGITFTAKELRLVRLDMLTHFFEQAQLQMAHKLDAMAYDTLVNGNEGYNEDIAIVGVTTANSLVWEDIRRVQLQMAMLGKKPSTILASPESDLMLMSIPEFKGGMFQNTLANVNSAVPLPQTLELIPNLWSTGKQLMFVNSSQALQLVISSPLQFENEKEILSQEFNFVCTMDAAFVKGTRDSSIILDYSLAFASNGFPDYMDLKTYRNAITA